MEQIKTCTKCKESKTLDCFSIGKGGYKEAKCKTCRNAYFKVYRSTRKEYYYDKVKTWRAENPERTKEWNAEYNRAFYEANREEQQERARNYRTENLEEIQERERSNRKLFPHIYNARQAKRRAAILRATPLWADFKKIEAVYELSSKMTRETGIPHEFDHYYPLQGKDVCGLHVHDNLRVIIAIVNRKKSNHSPKD